MHCLFQFTRGQSGYHGKRVSDTVEQSLLILLKRARQYVVHDLILVSGVTYTYAQAPAILPYVGKDIAQPIMTAMTPAAFESSNTRRQINVIVYHQDVRK
jgi:hypothetical protein